MRVAAANACIVLASATPLTAIAAITGPNASAHDSVIGSNPQNGSVVQQFPEKLELEFSGEVEEGFNTVALSRADGEATEVVYTGEPEVHGRDVTLQLPEGFQAQPGQYRVGFQIVSSDGHATKGMTTFDYAPDGQVGGEPEVVDTQNAEQRDAGESRGFELALVFLGVLAVAGAAFAMVARQRRARQLKGVEK